MRKAKGWTTEDIERLQQRGLTIVEKRQIETIPPLSVIEEHVLEIKQLKSEIIIPKPQQITSDGKQIIYGACPSKSNCYRIAEKDGHPSLVKTETLRNYENNFYIQCASREKLITGYFEFHMDVFYPTERADLDNSLKVVLDCLQKVKVIKNDNKCTKIVVQKFKDVDRPRIEFLIKEV